MLIFKNNIQLFKINDLDMLNNVFFHIIIIHSNLNLSNLYILILYFIFINLFHN